MHIKAYTHIFIYTNIYKYIYIYYYITFKIIIILNNNIANIYITKYSCGHPPIK